MIVINKIFDFGKFYLVSELKEDATTVDIVAASSKYTMQDQKSGSLFTSGRMTVIDKDDTDNFISLAFSNCVENGFINGLPRYTLTIRKASDGTTYMMGLANTDSGSNDITNVIAANKTDVFPLQSDSLCLVTVGAAEYNEMLALFQNALAEITEQSDQLAQKVFFSMKQMEQRLKDDQDTYETAITAQQTAFEAQMESEFDNFVATQREITVKINDSDSAKIDVSSGNWLVGTTEKIYAGITALAVTLSATRYYELNKTSGILEVQTSGFTAGAYPIAKVVADATEVTSVTNYGAAYFIPNFPEVVATSAGAADSGKLAELNASGLFDSSFLPAVAALTNVRCGATTSESSTITHNLGVTPKAILIYRRGYCNDREALTFWTPDDGHHTQEGYNLGYNQVWHAQISNVGSTTFDLNFTYALTRSLWLAIG